MSFRDVIMTGSTAEVLYRDQEDKTWSIQSIIGGPDGSNPFTLTNFDSGELGSTCILNFGGNASQWFTNRVLTLNMRVPGIGDNIRLQVTMVSPALRARQITTQLDELTRDLTELFPENQECDAHRERAEHSAQS